MSNTCKHLYLLYSPLCHWWENLEWSNGWNWSKLIDVSKGLSRSLNLKSDLLPFSFTFNIYISYSETNHHETRKWKPAEHFKPDTKQDQLMSAVKKKKRIAKYEKEGKKFSGRSRLSPRTGIGICKPTRKTRGWPVGDQQEQKKTVGNKQQG